MSWRLLFLYVAEVSEPYNICIPFLLGWRRYRYIQYFYVSWLPTVVIRASVVTVLCLCFFSFRVYVCCYYVYVLFSFSFFGFTRSKPRLRLMFGLRLLGNFVRVLIACFYYYYYVAVQWRYLHSFATWYLWPTYVQVQYVQVVMLSESVLSVHQLLLLVPHVLILYLQLIQVTMAVTQASVAIMVCDDKVGKLLLLLLLLLKLMLPLLILLLLLLLLLFCRCCSLCKIMCTNPVYIGISLSRLCCCLS